MFENKHPSLMSNGPTPGRAPTHHENAMALVQVGEGAGTSQKPDPNGKDPYSPKEPVDEINAGMPEPIPPERRGSTVWPRFIGIGDGDWAGEMGWVNVNDQATVVKCISNNLKPHTSDEPL